MTFNKLLVSLSIVWLLFLSGNLQAETITLAESVNRAGQQRMLSQRIAKNYLLLTHRINAHDAQKEMHAAINRFEENLASLKQSVISADVQQKISALEQDWKHFYQLVGHAQPKIADREVLILSDKVLQSAHQLVLNLEQSSGIQSANLINISGRQRMLSQRIALYYTASFVGLREDEIHILFEQAVKEFGEGLQLLLAAEINDQDITSSLKEVEKQWTFYRERFDEIGTREYIPRVIRVITEGFLTDMERITSMYEKILS